MIVSKFLTKDGDTDPHVSEDIDSPAAHADATVVARYNENKKHSIARLRE